MTATYLAGNRLLDQIAGATSPTIPATYYFALSTTTPTVSGTNFTEPTTVGTAYDRVTVANNKTTFGSAASNSVTTLISVSFPESTASWGTVTYVGIYDAATVGTGNLLYYGVLSPSRAIATGTVFYFPIGAITFTVA